MDRELALTLVLVCMVASMFSFVPTTIIVFRRWLRGAHRVSGRANVLSLAALMVFQLVIFAPQVARLLGLDDAGAWTDLALVLVPALVVVALNLAAWRTWRAFIRAEQLTTQVGGGE